MLTFQEKEDCFEITVERGSNDLVGLVIAADSKEDKEDWIALIEFSLMFLDSDLLLQYAMKVAVSTSFVDS